MTLEILAQKNPFLITDIGDLQADMIRTKTSFEGNTIENITSELGLTD